MLVFRINFRLLICSVVCCLFLVSCSNMKMNNYVKSYEQNAEYGDIESYKQLNIDKKIKNLNLEQKLRVGVLLPLSGEAKTLGESLLNAIQLSMFENNKNNILLKIYDTKGTDFGAVEAMNNAIEDGIDTIVGPLFYAETKAISEIARKHNIVIFSLSNEQKLMNTDSVFVTGSIIEQEIDILLNNLIKNGKTNFVAFLPNNVFGSTVNDILKRKLKGKDAYLINTEFYTQSTELFETKLLNLLKSYRVSEEFLHDYEQKKANSQMTGEKVEYIAKEEDKIYPDVLFIVDGEKIAQNIGMVLYKNPKIASNIQLAATSKIDNAKNLEKNVYLDNLIFVGSNPEKFDDFSKKYYETYSVPALKISTIAYDLISDIDKFYVKKDGKYLINKTKLLNPYGYDSIDGKFRFLPNGLVERNYYILQLKNKQKTLISDSEDFLNY